MLCSMRTIVICFDNFSTTSHNRIRLFRADALRRFIEKENGGSVLRAMAISKIFLIAIGEIGRQTHSSFPRAPSSRRSLPYFSERSNGLPPARDHRVPGMPWLLELTPTQMLSYTVISGKDKGQLEGPTQPFLTDRIGGEIGDVLSF